MGHPLRPDVHRGVSLPESGTSRPAIKRSIVLLPLPVGPNRASSSPGRRSRDISHTTGSVPKAFDILRHSITAIAGSTLWSPLTETASILPSLLSVKGKVNLVGRQLVGALILSRSLIEIEPRAVSSSQAPFSEQKKRQWNRCYQDQQQAGAAVWAKKAASARRPDGCSQCLEPYRT